MLYLIVGHIDSVKRWGSSRSPGLEYNRINQWTWWGYHGTDQAPGLVSSIRLAQMMSLFSAAVLAMYSGLLTSSYPRQELAMSRRTEDLRCITSLLQVNAGRQTYDEWHPMWPRVRRKCAENVLSYVTCTCIQRKAGVMYILHFVNRFVSLSPCECTS